MESSGLRDPRSHPQTRGFNWRRTWRAPRTSAGIRAACAMVQRRAIPLWKIPGANWLWDRSRSLAVIAVRCKFAGVAGQTSQRPDCFTILVAPSFLFVDAVVYTLLGCYALFGALPLRPGRELFSCAQMPRPRKNSSSSAAASRTPELQLELGLV